MSFFTCVFCAGEEPPSTDDDPSLQARLSNNPDRTAEEAEIDGVYGLCGEWKVAEVQGLDEFLEYKGASGAERKMSAKASANMVSANGLAEFETVDAPRSLVHSIATSCSSSKL
mmetsp:Transcript_8062/g.20621  ORF Transcript_8062/g.20621 Transcript_8062/m.20621 type:complete len:114 (-) Transcript_8062:403-744(-)